MSSIAVPPFKPMYSRALSAEDLSAISSKSSGEGTLSVIRVTCPGLVPQVTNGSRSSQSISINVSNVASSSLASARHCSTARSNFSPLGTNLRPRIHSKVVSSGAISPALAPASIVILQTVIRPAISRPRIAAPVYSIT